jgi:hypothetical protein
VSLRRIRVNEIPNRSLQELETGFTEPFVRDPRHLQTGKPVKRFGNLRPRELLTNWLVCAAFNHECASPDRLTFTSDPTGGDGILLDTQTKETFPTEHVMVPAAPRGKTVDVDALVLAAIEAKNKKGGPAYGSGRTLIVFLNAGTGSWSPNRVAKQLPNPLHFAVVWMVGLHHVNAGEYIYAVTQLTLENGTAPTFLIRIARQFNSWKMTRIQ